MPPPFRLRQLPNRRYALGVWAAWYLIAGPVAYGIGRLSRRPDLAALVVLLTFGAFVIWQCTSLVVARASVQALYAKEAEFLRTPKTMEEGSFWDAIRGNRGETILGVLGLLGIAAVLFGICNYILLGFNPCIL